MKSKFVRSLVLVAGLSGVLTVPIVDSWAQPGQPAKHVAQRTRSATAFKIEHVRAEMMATWLQTLVIPAAQQEAKKEGGKTYQIPGLESVAARPKTNEVLATGTDESLAELRKFISSIDQPARTVEVKVQFIEVDKLEVEKLGLSYNVLAKESGGLSTKSDGVPAPSSSLVRELDEFQGKITKLLSVRRARVLHSSQVTTPNNSPVKVNSPANGIAPELEWSLTPTIHNDDTITLFFTPQVNSNLSKRFLTTVANIKKGDVLVLLIQSSEDERRELLVLVSTQIIED